MVSFGVGGGVRSHQVTVGKLAPKLPTLHCFNDSWVMQYLEGYDVKSCEMDAWFDHRNGQPMGRSW